MLKSLSEPERTLSQLAAPCSLDVSPVRSPAHLCMYVMWLLKAFVLKELVRGHNDTRSIPKRTDDDIFIPQIILRSDYFSIKMIDLT